MRRFPVRFLSLLVAFALAAFFTHPLWLPAFGTFLVQTQPPQKADAVIVLAGDYSGSRILRGADLVRDGLAPFALVSGPWEMYGHNEAHLAISFAVSKGLPQQWFRPVLHRSDSTREEAVVFRDWLAREQLRRVLVVTSNFHTRRAGAIFRRTIPGVEIVMIAAPWPGLDPASWWTTRAGRKVIFQEWVKTLADWWNI